MKKYSRKSGSEQASKRWICNPGENSWRQEEMDKKAERFYTDPDRGTPVIRAAESASRVKSRRRKRRKTTRK